MAESRGKRSPSILIVIPCLNEAAHIGSLLGQLALAAGGTGAMIVVVDGGSHDGTPSIVERFAAMNPHIRLLHNPRRIQASAINLAVASYGDSFDYLIRMDAHGGYPDDFCERLVEEAVATGADSVVVSMDTSGHGIMQAAAAAAQTSRLGTGGSSHRHRTGGGWVDHGHHALMRISAFRAVGGYDESFSHNEDAELDHRLREAGYRIWLTGRTRMTYYPRASLASLHRQYLNYGRGRARNVLKHRIVPRLRQMIPLLVAPVVLLAMLGFVHWITLVPLAIWLSVCLGFGIWTAIIRGKPQLVLAGLSVMIMHFSWSLGFWAQLLGGGSAQGEAAR